MATPYDYIARGWMIFPCHTIVRGVCSCPKGSDCPSPGKHPRTANGVKDATRNPDMIRTWEERFPHTNWAVACGEDSGIIVIDVDPRKDGFGSIDELETMRPDGPLPTTLLSNTGGAGRHYIFEYPTGANIPNRNAWLSGVDVKSNGGYVILPYAEHISGGTYTWANWGQPLAPLPQDILQMLLAPTSGGGGATDLPETSDILRGVPEGERDNTLFRAACRWRRQLGDGAKEAVLVLALTAARNCDPPFPDDQAIKCVNQAWKQDHDDDTASWAMGVDADIDDQYNLTDVGNAKRFVAQWGDRFRYVEGWGWLSWTDIGWRMGADAYATQTACDLSKLIIQEAKSVTDNRVQAAYGRWALKSESAGKIDAAVRLARVQEKLLLGIDDFDADDHLLNCRNVIVDLRDGKTRLIDQNDRITKNTHVVYDPDFKLKEWDEFLLQSTEGDLELIEYLQRAAGYTLTGSNAEECFFIISGPPASGKSTFIDALHSALGKYATTTQSETILYQRNQQNPERELARLAGTRLVSISEIREGASFNEALIKQITGGDRITGRFLYREAFEFRPQFKMWIATNHDPDARDDAIWRRLKKVGFNHAVPPEERNPDLKRMLQDPEVGGKAVLAWAVEGAKKWYADGLKEPAKVKMEVSAYKEEQDRTWAFVLDCVGAVEGASVSMNDMYRAYATWCQMNHEPQRRPVQFKKALQTRGLKTVLDDRGRVVFINVALRTATVTASGGVEWT